MKTLLELMKMSKGEGSTCSQPMNVDFLPVDLKLEGLATYLSWSRRFKGDSIKEGPCGLSDKI